MSWDENPSRGAEAAKYGARVITDPGALAEGYSIVVDASGDAEMLVTAIRHPPSAMPSLRRSSRAFACSFRR